MGIIQQQPPSEVKRDNSDSDLDDSSDNNNNNNDNCNKNNSLKQGFNPLETKMKQGFKSMRNDNNSNNNNKNNNKPKKQLSCRVIQKCSKKKY